jgi:hypothetical protein
MEAICSSETSVNAKSTQRHIPEDDILQKDILFKKAELFNVKTGHAHSSHYAL